MKRHYLLLFVVSFSLVACTKEIKLNLDTSLTRLVVEGNIYSMPGPYIFRLSESKQAISGISSTVPVLNADLTICDDLGNCDTLMPAPDSIRGYVKYYEKRGDSLMLDSLYVEAPNSWCGPDGYYQTKKLRGTVGRTYFLTIVVDGIKYTANAFMPGVPDLDSIGVGIRYSIKDNKPYRVPRYYFRNDEYDGFYQASTSVYSGVDEDSPLNVPVFSQRQCYQFMLLEDRYLDTYVNGVFVDQTCSNNPVYFDQIGEWGNGYLLSLTMEHYNFLKTLVGQLRSDGGTFRPAPSNPIGNISNGALGFFGACGVSRRFFFER